MFQLAEPQPRPTGVPQLTQKRKTKKTFQASIPPVSGQFCADLYGGIHVPYGLHVFRDFLLKPELVRAISDLGFEHPSEGD